MTFGSLDGGDDDEHAGLCVVEIFKIFAMQAAFFVARHHLTEFTSEQTMLCGLLNRSSLVIGSSMKENEHNKPVKTFLFLYLIHFCKT